MINNLHNHKENGLSLVVFALGLAALLGFAALAIDLGISNNIQNELQKITTTAALVGALEMEPDELGNIDEPAAQQAAVDAFREGCDYIPMLGNAVLVNPLTNATSLNDTSFIQTIAESRAVRLQTRAEVNTFFMAVIGIKSLQVNAQAAAINNPAYPELNLPAPGGSVIAADIKDPVGGTNNNIYKGVAGNEAAFILGPPDDVPVALGPGGSVELRTPAPIIDGPGPDIYVKEIGDLEGYYLYVLADDGAGGIDIINISCTGVPSENALANPLPTAAGVYMDSNDSYKFYGSGLFDLATDCSTGPSASNYTGQVRNANGIIIVDDNAEDGILSSDLSRSVFMPGEHSSTSPGADIDSIAVLHHSRSIDFNSPDTDGDGLVDPFEYLLGTNENVADTDADGIDDGDEMAGSNGFITNPRVGDTDGDGVNDGTEITNGTNPLFAGNNGDDYDDD